MIEWTEGRLAVAMTIIIALATVLYALLAAKSLKLALFEKRFPLFQVLTQFMAAAVGSRNVSMSSWRNSAELRPIASFSFLRPRSSSTSGPSTTMASSCTTPNPSSRDRGSCREPTARPARRREPD